MGRWHRTLRHPQEKEISVSASEAVGKQASPSFLGHIGKPFWEAFWQHLSIFHMGPRKSSSVWTQSGSYFFPKGTELVMNLIVKLDIGRAQRCWSETDAKLWVRRRGHFPAVRSWWQAHHNAFKDSYNPTAIVREGISVNLNFEQLQMQILRILLKDL